MKSIVFSLFFFLSFSILALPTAKIIKLKGSASYNGKVLKLGDTLQGKGVLETKKASFIKLEIKEWGNHIVLGPSSEMNLALTSKEVQKKYEITKGICRWKSYLRKKQNKGVIFSKQASIGVRGTDYFLKVNPLLGETEIVVFEGQVLFSNLSDQKDAKLINENQWGGLGGRFGGKISNILTLPSNVIDHFKRYLNI
ncbi:FecR domain-containing protein [Halobacteriovorax sp. GB3]|uniref:FecR domain-containing protein n=1 Tax=Halobacteriovorax sp. GB3 TaxID=2719615 RepID=UPI00235EE4FC|nr:FecR domain-containing protein [Halobacteriovorax sp. GB3]MDD0853673.1 FecR domain-containing protein [Halobacteriovorax sp. GB3]